MKELSFLSSPPVIQPGRYEWRRPLKNFKSLSLSTLLCSSLVLISSAQATPITYDFSANINAGPLAGNVYTGYFSYDSSIVTPGASLSATGLLSDLNFTFGSSNYDETNANTGFLSWDTAGDLTGVMFGNLCFAGTCVVNVGSEQWVFRYLAGNTNIQDLTYSPLGDTGIYFSTISTSISARANAIPEPANLLLLFAGLGALALSRRRK